MSDVLDIEKPDENEVDDFAADVRAAMGEVGHEPKPETRLEIDKPDSRARDEAGKFVEKPKEDVTKPPVADTTATQQVVTDASQTAQLSAKAPPGWTPAMRDEFSKLPPHLQAYISQHDNSQERRLTQQDEDRLLGKKVNQMATPYLPTIRAEGATVEKAFQDYLQTAHVLRSGTDFQKAQSIAAVMQTFRVNPQALLSVLQGGNVVQGVPSQQGYNPVVDTLQQRLDRIETERREEIQQRQAQEQASLQSQINEFSTKPGHEHFEKVRTVMGTLLESGIAKDLEDAYERAVYADPEIRLSLIAGQQQTVRDNRTSELNAKNTRARNAAASVTGAPGSSRPLNGSGSVGSIEDDLRAAMRERSGRV